MTAAVFGLLIGVAAGSIPFAWLLHRLATGRDLRREGSGNPGATNVERADGWGWGLAALTLDAGKGAVAVLLAAVLAGVDARIPAAVGAVLGHMFTPWLRGSGGKGVATTAGAFAVLAPLPTAFSFVVFLVVAASSRFISLASVLGAAALPIAILALGPGFEEAGVAAVLGVLIAWRHRANFERMRAGTEPRLGGSSPGPGGV